MIKLVFPDAILNANFLFPQHLFLVSQQLLKLLSLLLLLLLLPIGIC